MLLKGHSDLVVPPRQNGDRLGYVSAVGATREQAELVADAYIAANRIDILDGQQAVAQRGQQVASAPNRHLGNLQAL